MDVDHMMSQSDVLNQALEWQVTFWSGEVTEDEQRTFQQWIKADTRHAAIWSQLQKTDNKLGMLTLPGAAPAIRASRQSLSRRKALRVLGLFVGTGIVINTVRTTPQWQSVAADYHTDLGKRRDITLADGTQITLNTATAIDVTFDDTHRLVRIRHGEIFVVTAPDHGRENNPRPFLVQTTEGTVRPIGTRFNVRQDDKRSLVAVLEGIVEITPRATRGNPIRLLAGQQTSFSEHDVASIESTSTANHAWVRGLLVAERMRLEDFITELARYRRGFLRCDPAVANLIVSGVYTTEDTDKTLASLADALPIRAQYLSRYWVAIQPRQ
jgi:transmembrane sensor